MSKKDALAFLNQIADDTELMLAAKAAGKDKIIDVAARAGFYVTLEELKMVSKEIKGIESELEKVNKAQPLVINSTENVENMKNVLREVEEILESSIQQKVKMTRYIDKLLKQKNREFAELQNKTTDSK